MVKLFLKNSNLCDHNSPTSQTDRQTDRQTTCDRNNALCTKVHRSVKSLEQENVYKGQTHPTSKGRGHSARTKFLYPQPNFFARVISIFQLFSPVLQYSSDWNPIYPSRNCRV